MCICFRVVLMVFASYIQTQRAYSTRINYQQSTEKRHHVQFLLFGLNYWERMKNSRNLVWSYDFIKRIRKIKNENYKKWCSLFTEYIRARCYHFFSCCSSFPFDLERETRQKVSFSLARTHIFPSIDSTFYSWLFLYVIALLIILSCSRSYKFFIFIFFFRICHNKDLTHVAFY